MIEYALFETEMGVCGVVWSRRGIRGFQLPEKSAAAVRRRLGAHHPDALEGRPPAAVKKIIRQVQAHLGGAAQDFSNVRLDLEDVPEFHRKVYLVAQAIPSGQTVTYGELARRVGSPQSARAVGQALGRNPIALVVPCHRVLAAGRKPGGFSAFGGLATKSALLKLEGVEL